MNSTQTRKVRGVHRNDYHTFTPFKKSKKEQRDKTIKNNSNK